MHKVIGHAIHRILYRAIGKAAKSAAVSIYEDSFGENSHNRLPTNPENTYDFAKPKDIKRFFQYMDLKTMWDEVNTEFEARRQDEHNQELLWYASLTPTQQKAIDAAYRNGSYKFNNKNRNNVPLSPAQKRNIINPQPMPIKLQVDKFARTLGFVLLLLLVWQLFLLIYNGHF